MTLIEVSDLTIGHGGEPLLRDLSFAVEDGEIFGILGPSGCGKSTLMRNMIGLDVPISGNIEVRGATLPPPPDEPPRFGVMFQSGALFGSMTLLDNIALPLHSWTDLAEEAIDSIALGKLRLVGLGGFENHMPSELSGGMKKRAGIARALALEPSLVFLDEPSAGLDPILSVEIDDLLLTLRERLGLTVVIVTHELESIFKIVDRCIMLDNQAQGAIACGDPRELRKQLEPTRVHQFFNRLPSSQRSA